MHLRLSHEMLLKVEKYRHLRMIASWRLVEEINQQLVHHSDQGLNYLVNQARYFVVPTLRVNLPHHHRLPH